MLRGRIAMGRVAVVAVAGTIALATSVDASALPVPVAVTAGVADDGDVAGLFDIGGGRRIYLECRGTGSPTVVFVSGFGNGADIWSERGAEVWRDRNPGASGISVLPAIAPLTRACAYDRPNTSLLSGEPSRSDPVPAPTSLDAKVADLHALLQAADVPGPYVLVGHSMGGLVARLFASIYPDEVAGFVSVDAAHEIYYEGYQELLRPDQYQLPGAENDPVADGARMRTARIEQPLQQMPMVVLEHSRDRALVPNPFDLPPDWPIEPLERFFQAAQEDLTTLVPGARHVIATESEHYIQVAQPEVVIEAIDAVVEAVRHGETRLGPGVLAGTGATNWILVATAMVLVGLGVMLVVTSRRGMQQQRRPGP